MTRTEQEEALALALLTAWRKYGDQQHIPWAHLEQDLKPVLARHLATTYLDSALAEAGEHDIPNLDRAALQWADSYARNLAGQIAASTRRQVEAAREQSKEELGIALAIMFSSARADSIAVTETTAAVTNGQKLAAGYLDRVLGRVTIGYWQCEEDCCDVCADLDDEAPEIWQPVSPGGPPAHPHCRCWLEYRTRD